VPVDLSGQPHGYPLLVGTFSRTTADGPVVQHAVGLLPDVDREGPRAYNAWIDHEVFHPVTDGHLDRARFTAHVWNEAATVTLRMVHDTTGRQVVVPSTVDPSRDLMTATWDGRLEDGTLAAPGTWTAHVEAVDAVGNQELTITDSVRLTHRELVPVTRTYALTAEESMVRKRTQRCGRVVQGRWPEGVGLRTGACHNFASAATVHRHAQQPRGWVRGTIAVSAYGRSAEWRANRLPREAVLSVRWSRQERKRMLEDPAWYEGAPQRSSRVLDSTDTLEWRVYVDSATRYDVRAFRVTYDGVALR
jgi:hypothetical protein